MAAQIVQLDREVNIDTFSPSSANVQLFGRHFMDDHGRILHLRGANVSASSKIPIEPAPKLHDHRNSSYIGRPFPLEDADEHWKRLKSWGLTFIRINVTWEAIEHGGMGVYDEAYLNYLRDLLSGLSKHGIIAYVAIHQDVWSRYSGGSGAPGWTLELAGFDLSNDGEKLSTTGAAFLDGVRGTRLEGERGLWPTGYQKLAAATMNTLFWGGETFAPLLKVADASGKQANIQHVLQNAFLSAFERLVQAVGDLDSVIGFELMNEPHPGFIGLSSVHEWNYNTDLHLGAFPSPLQSFSSGAGHPTPSVPIYTRSFPFPTRHTSSTTLNPNSISAWVTECPWEKEGVWRWSVQKNKAVALQEDYFTKNRDGGKVDFYRDHYFPFVQRWGEVVNSRLERMGEKGKGKNKALMVGVIPNEYCPEWPSELRPKNMVYAPHWYDLNALFKKQFGHMTVNVQGLSRGMFVLKALYFGKGVYKNYAKQIKNVVFEGRRQLGEIPTIIGECGVPMDLNGERALRDGDWKWQARMMDAMLSAMDEARVGFNLWTYNPANKDDTGDQWNAENFSFYSDANRQKALTAQASSHSTPGGTDAGGRLLRSIVRPYAIATAGTPTSTEYASATSIFTLRFRSPIIPTEDPKSTTPPALAHITEIYLPYRVYGTRKLDQILSPGGRILYDLPKQRAYIWFVDVPTEEEVYRKKSERTRRVDIWVPEIADEEKQVSMWYWLLSAIVLLAVLALGYWAQVKQWEREKAWGVKSAWPGGL